MSTGKTLARVVDAIKLLSETQLWKVKLTPVVEALEKIADAKDDAVFVRCLAEHIRSFIGVYPQDMQHNFYVVMINIVHSIECDKSSLYNLILEALLEAPFGKKTIRSTVELIASVHNREDPLPAAFTRYVDFCMARKVLISREILQLIAAVSPEKVIEYLRIRSYNDIYECAEKAYAVFMMNPLLFNTIPSIIVTPLLFSSPRGIVQLSKFGNTVADFDPPSSQYSDMAVRLYRSFKTTDAVDREIVRCLGVSPQVYKTIVGVLALITYISRVASASELMAPFVIRMSVVDFGRIGILPNEIEDVLDCANSNKFYNINIGGDHVDFALPRVALGHTPGWLRSYLASLSAMRE